MSVEQLVNVLEDTRSLLARPGNEFAWSSWKNQAAALEDMDRAIAKARNGQIAKIALDLLFAPTGDIQEVSVSSGWGEEFHGVAARYDQAIAASARPWWRFW
jgi:hypothetical protein